MRRRDFLAAVAGGVAVGAGAATAAHEDSNWRAKPDGVTIEYDEPWLETHQPLLVTDHETRRRINGLYACRVGGDAYEYDVACYWLQATHQDGLAFFDLVFRPDSHLGDHEPVYVYVDDDGTVDRVVYSTYHHFAGEVTPDSARFQAVRTSDETHVTLRVIPEWHNYSADTDRDGSFLELRDWVSSRDSWLDNEFYERTADEAVEDPETMLRRDSWWDESTTDYRAGELFAWIGLRGAEQADDIKD